MHLEQLHIKHTFLANLQYRCHTAMHPKSKCRPLKKIAEINEVKILFLCVKCCRYIPNMCGPNMAKNTMKKKFNKPITTPPVSRLEQKQQLVDWKNVILKCYVLCFSNYVI